MLGYLDKIKNLARTKKVKFKEYKNPSVKEVSSIFEAFEKNEDIFILKTIIMVKDKNQRMNNYVQRRRDAKNIFYVTEAISFKKLYKLLSKLTVELRYIKIQKGAI